MQRLQSIMQERVLAAVLNADPGATISVPWFVRLIFQTPLRNVPARLLSFGFRPSHISHELKDLFEQNAAPGKASRAQA